MSKKFLISEEERSRILNLHNNFDFKKLIQETKENQLLLESDLNDKGQYYPSTDVKIKVHKDGTVLPIGRKTMFYGNDKVNGISFYVTNVKIGTTTGGNFYQNVFGDIRCDNQDNYISLRMQEKNLGVQIKSGYFMNPHEGFTNKLRGMFCCGKTLKAYEKRKNAKYNKDWRKCGGGSDEKCSDKELQMCKNKSQSPITSSFVQYYYSRDGKCYAGQPNDGSPGFPTLERCNKCCSGQTPIPPIPPVSQCPQGVKPCAQYTDCTSTDMTTDGTGNKITMCSKCESVKRLQGCLGVKQDGLWGCKTESALQSKYPGMNGQNGLTKEEIDKVCTKVAD